MEIGGVRIPAHQHVLMVFGAAHRDPVTFAEPDALDVRRPDTRRHLSFGHGIHYCLGAPLARMEAQIAFSSLLRRFPSVRLAVAPEELHWLYGIPVRRLVGLPVILGPRA